MTISSASWDTLEGDFLEEQEAEAPSLELLDEVFRSLDGVTHTLLCVQHDGGASLMIGGGPTQYVVCLETAEGSLYTLTRETDETAKVCLTAGGQEGDYPGRQVVGKELARGALTWFVEGGLELAGLPGWEKDVGDGP